MSIGFIICARLNSRRVPGKALAEVNGRPLLNHLVDRLKKTRLPVIVAVPEAESDIWEPWLRKNPGVHMWIGHDENPLARIYDAAIDFRLKTVIRVTHDKVFVDPDEVLKAVVEFQNKKLDYLYSSTLTDGTGFEIISLDSLAQAHEQFDQVEHISYAIKAVTENIWDMPFKAEKNVRLLCDYEEDLVFLETVLATLGNDCTKKQVESFCRTQRWVNELNRLPQLTVYTCGYNAQEWIQEAMESVAAQENFRRMEYILIDDCSTDRTMFLMAKFKSKYPNVKLYRNPKNIGLASSSNVALKNAKGKFIIRLDADDYFVSPTSCRELISEISSRNVDVIYPANFLGSTSIVQQPDDQHHVGGAIFKTAALNHLKFTDGMRGYEGLDLYARAREQLRVGYFSRPIFFYRQHGSSMSKTNLEEREAIKRSLVDKYGPEMARS